MRLDGAKLKRLRDAKKFDQQRLAVVIGANQSQISRYERGITEPSGRTAIALAKALGVSPSDLYGLDDDEEEAAAMPMTREEQEVLLGLFARLADRAVKA